MESQGKKLTPAYGIWGWALIICVFFWMGWSEVQDFVHDENRHLASVGYLLMSALSLIILIPTYLFWWKRSKETQTRPFFIMIFGYLFFCIGTLALPAGSAAIVELSDTGSPDWTSAALTILLVCGISLLSLAVSYLLVFRRSA